MTNASSPAEGRWIALGGLWLAYCAFGLTAAGLAPLVPEIRAEMGISNTTLGAILGSWQLVYLVAAIPAGVLLDAIGVRLGVFLAALFIALSAALRAFAHTPFELMLAVMVFGAGGPLISVGAPKLISQLFDSRSRGTAIGIYMTGPNIGGIMSLTLTPAVLLPLTGNWRNVLMTHAGFALIAALVWLAAARLSHLSASSPNREKFEPKALRDIFSHADILIVLAMAVGVFFINHALSNWLPAVLRSTGMSPSTAGYMASVPTLVGLVAGLTIPRFATRSRRLPMLITIFAVAGVASQLIAAGPGDGLTAGLVLQGIVRGAMNSLTILVLVELPSIPQNRVGLASGVFFSAGEIGGVLGPFSFGFLRDVSGGFDMPLNSLTIIAVILILLASALIFREKRSTY